MAQILTFPPNPSTVQPSQARWGPNTLGSRPVQSDQAHSAPRIAIFFLGPDNSMHHGTWHSTYTESPGSTQAEVRAYIERVEQLFRVQGCKLVDIQLLMGAVVEVGQEEVLPGVDGVLDQRGLG